MAKRQIYFYKEHFRDFFRQQNWKVQKKILWTIDLVETIDVLPEIYFKHLEGTVGLYEIRVQHAGNIFRIFCFFDDSNIVVIGHGFQKKTQKTPLREIEKALRLKDEYYAEKFDQP